MEEGPDPPCLPYSDLELRQSGMTRSEAAQILTGARDLRRLSADACLFHGFENRAPSGRFTSRSHQITAFTGARRPHPEMRDRCTDAAVVWLRQDLSPSRCGN